MCKLRTINNYFRIGTFMDNDDPFVELPADRADVRDWIERVKKAYVVIRGNIERAQEAMPSRPMGPEIEFDVWDLVLVEMEAVRSSPRTDEASKLQIKWMGPYKVTKQLGGKSYELELPASMSRVTNHFHVRRLRTYIPSPFLVNESLYDRPKATLDEDGNEVYHVLKFVGYRLRKRGWGKPVPQLKVR